MEKHPFYSKDQIAAYLNGDMSDAQAEAFENLLDNDPFFEAIVEGMRLQKVAKQMLDEDPGLLEGYENLNHDRLLDNIRSKSYQFEFKPAERNTKVRPLNTKWTWQAAAAAVLLVGLGTWGVYKSTSTLTTKQPIAKVADNPLTQRDLKLPLTKVVDDIKLTDHKNVSEEEVIAQNTQQTINKPSTPFVAPVKKEKTPKVDEEMQKLIAFNNDEVKYWEGELSNFQTRSSNRSLTILNPIVGTKLSKNEVLFEVKYEGNNALYLTVFESGDMRKAVIMELPFSKAKNPKMFTYLMKNLKKGTYYWKITNDEEELSIGKFQKVK